MPSQIKQVEAEAGSIALAAQRRRNAATDNGLKQYFLGKNVPVKEAVSSGSAEVGMLLDAMAAAGIVFKRRPSSGGRPVARPNSAKPTAGGGRPGSAKPAAAADASSQPPSLIALTEPSPSDAEADAELLAPAACDWGMTDTAPLVPKRSPPRPGSGHHSKRPGSAAVSKTSGLEVPMGPLETKATEMLRRRRDLEIKAERLRQERLHGGSGHHREAPGPPSVAAAFGIGSGSGSHLHSPKRAPPGARRLRPGSAPGSIHSSQQPMSNDVRDYGSPPGSPIVLDDDGNPVAIPMPVSRPQFAHQYARNARLQQIHMIYGQYLGHPHRNNAPATPHASGGHLAGGYGTILVGDYFPMPASPGVYAPRRPPSAARMRSAAPAAPNYRPAPSALAPASTLNILNEAQQMAERPLQM